MTLTYNLELGNTAYHCILLYIYVPNFTRISEEVDLTIHITTITTTTVPAVTTITTTTATNTATTTNITTTNIHIQTCRQSRRRKHVETIRT